MHSAGRRDRMHAVDARGRRLVSGPIRAGGSEPRFWDGGRADRRRPGSGCRPAMIGRTESGRGAGDGGTSREMFSSPPKGGQGGFLRYFTRDGPADGAFLYRDVPGPIDVMDSLGRTTPV